MTRASVVIVNYNSGRFLECCVDSVFRSDCSLEIIVVDNASTDGSADLLNKYVRSDISLHVIRNEVNCGFSAAINQGVRESNSTNILLLNPDCLVFPHTIHLLSDALNEDVSTGILGGLVFNFDGSEQRGCRRREPTLARSLGKALQRDSFSVEFNKVDMTDEPLPGKRICVDAVSGSFLMIQRTIFFAVGGMDEGFFLHFEDVDLCRRVRDAGWKVVFAPDISIFHYRGGSSEQMGDRISWEKHRSMWRYQLKHHGRNLWLRALVFLMVWSHFLLQRTIWRFTQEFKTLDRQNWSLVEWVGLPCATVSSGNQGGKRLVILGLNNESVREIIQSGATIGWSIYVCNELENVDPITDVYWIHPEYFDKVPICDAPEIDGLLILTPSSCRGVADRIVTKFRVRRIAVIQPVAHPDRPNVDNVTISSKEKFHQEILDDSFPNNRIRGGETKLFSLPITKSGGAIPAIRVQRSKIIQDCFSWLSK